MAVRSSDFKPVTRWLAPLVLTLAVTVGCTNPEPVDASTVVVSDCPTPDQPYTETVTSTADPAEPWPGATVRFEIGVRRLQIDVGPMQEGRYVFPIPAGVARVTEVVFGDDNPNTWQVVGGDLFVRFLGPGGSWLVNDFPRITIVAELSPSLQTGDVIAWKPYRSFEQHFVNFDEPLACTVRDPDLVLQRMTVR